MDERLVRLLVSPATPIAQALKAIDAAGDRIVFVVDVDHTLLGVVTDGDIRRWIIEGKRLDGTVEAMMTRNPIVLGHEQPLDIARRMMIDRRVECVPVVDAAGKLVSAVWWLDLFEDRPVVHEHVGLPVVIMAGGRGARLSPFTNILPKPLLPLGDRTIIELIMERFANHGCTTFHLSVNYKANLIRAYFADVELPYDINYVSEDKPLGTAGSLAMLKETLDTTFFVTNCDILVEADYASIVRYHRESGNLITLVASMKNYTIPYGVAETAEGGALVTLTEKPEFNFLVSTGFYVLEPQVLQDIEVDEFAHITDVINRYLESGRKVGVYPVSEGAWLDIGELDALKETLQHLGIG